MTTHVITALPAPRSGIAVFILSSALTAFPEPPPDEASLPCLAGRAAQCTDYNVP